MNERVWIDPQGRTVPVSKVKEQHKLEDEMVIDLACEAMDIATRLELLKERTLADATAFRELLAQEYNTTRGGKKGNMTFRTFDGRLVMEVSVQDRLELGPELRTAKELVDQCVEEWSEGANDNLKVLVDDAFQVNRTGRIDTHRVLALRRLDIQEPTWLRAMDAISDAIRVQSSKTYTRFYSTDENGRRTAIILDIAKV